MAPGRNGRSRKSVTREPIEQPMTDYELQRARNILEKNRMFHQLGLGRLHELVGTKPVVAAREESDPLYELGEDTEPGDSDSEQGVVDEKSKFKDDPPTAIDYFKAIHCSSKTGYSEDALKAIAEMEAIAAQAPQEGQVAKTPSQALAQVLPTSKFLQNVGIESAATKKSAKAAEVAKCVQELESELVAEKEGAAEVRVQMDDLKNWRRGMQERIWKKRLLC